jgi:hypothetical protein
VQTKPFALAVVVVALCSALTIAPETGSAANAVPHAATSVIVRPGDDLNAVVAQAGAGDTIVLSPGRYRGDVRVDKALTLTGDRATIDAPKGTTGISITVDGVTVDSVAISCAAGAGSQGIRVTADHARIVDSPVLQCQTGIVLDHAKDAYLQGDALLGGDAAGRSSTGVAASGADGLTMLSNMFDSVATGVAIDGTTAPLVDANTFTGVGTAVSLTTVTNAVVHGTIVIGARGPAVLVSGSRASEIARLNPSGEGSGDAAAIRLSAVAGPSWMVTIEDTDFAHFATGLQIDAGAISAEVIVIGSTFSGVRGAAIDASPSAGGTVDASIGDYFGGCGPRAPDHGYDGGGATVTDPQLLVSYRADNCGNGSSSTGRSSAGSAAPSGSAPGGQVPPKSAPATAPAGADRSHGGGSSGIDLPSALGSVLVTVGVSLLLVVCAGGVLYAIRRSRNVH